MAILTFAYNHSRDPMNPAQLANQISGALALATDPQVDINPTQITVTHPGISSGNTAAIQNLINAYVFDPTWASGIAGIIQAKASTALTTNSTFLALASPTNAQTLAQVQALTKECNGLIRLLLNQLDSTTGT